MILLWCFDKSVYESFKKLIKFLPEICAIILDNCYSFVIFLKLYRKLIFEELNNNM